MDRIYLFALLLMIWGIIHQQKTLLINDNAAAAAHFFLHNSGPSFQDEPTHMKLNSKKMQI